MDGCFCVFICMCVLVHAYTIFLCVYVSISQQGILQTWKVWKSKQLFLIIPSISVTACKCGNEESQELCMPPAISMLRNSCSLSEPSSFLSSRSRTSSKVMILLNGSKCERMPFQALCSFLVFPFRKLELKVFLHSQIFVPDLNHFDSHYDQWFFLVHRSVTNKLYPKSYFFRL